MTSTTRPTLSKVNYRCWLGTQAIFIACFGALSLILPLINSLEDEQTAMLANTAQGRWQIGISTFASLVIVALFPALFSYGLSRIMGIEGGRDFKNNRALHMALALYVTALLCGVIGGIAFWLGRSPFNLFGL
jgi:hypothetical protein